MGFSSTVAVSAGLLALCCCSAENDSPSAFRVLDGDLEPMESALTYHTPAYHVHLRRALIDRAPRLCVLQFLVLPSFEPETLLSLHQVDGRYEAQVLAPKLQIWAFEGDVGKIECSECKKHLPVQTAERLCRVWNRMLLRTRHNVSRHLVLDGVGYAFMGYERGPGHMSGEASNPEQGTRPYVLADIGEAVVAYVRADSASEHAILAKVSKSLDELEASLATK